MKRDILQELISGQISADGAQGFYDEVMDSPDATNVPELLGLSGVEWTAFAHGVSLPELARWRHQGWPTTCLKCRVAIDIGAFGWLARELESGTHGIVHVTCPS